MPTIKDKIRAEAKRVEEDSIYSAKKHFEAAKPWRWAHYCMGVPTAALAAVAGVAAFSSHITVAGFAAVAVSAATAVSTFLDPNKRASDHMNAGNLYLALRNKARIFYEIRSMRELSEDELETELLTLTDRRDELNQISPSASGRSFKKARTSIESGEADYRIDLPKPKARAAVKSGQ